MKTPQKMIKAILKEYKDPLGEDYLPYLNHCFRVYYYAKTLLLMKESQKLAIAVAHHDLDIWVGNTMDYLGGSAELAKAYLKKNQLSYLPDEVAFIISSHHKLRYVKGNLEAEALRKADLIDLTSGFVHFQLPLQLISAIEVDHPRLGFTGMITKKVVKHALSHPFRPFPMIKF